MGVLRLPVRNIADDQSKLMAIATGVLVEQSDIAGRGSDAESLSTRWLAHVHVFE